MKKYLGNRNSTTLSKQNRTAAILVGSLGLALACVSQADAQSAKADNRSRCRHRAQGHCGRTRGSAERTAFERVRRCQLWRGGRRRTNRRGFPASAKIARGKAETAAAFWQSTGNLENAANGGRAALLSAGYVVMQGGIPLKINGKVVGAVGVSGGNKDQDDAVAKAGAASFGE